MNKKGKNHAILDGEKRKTKAIKILEIIKKYSEYKEESKILDIGTGSGYISNFFSENGFKKENVYSVDVVDQRQYKDGYNFSLVNNSILPYKDDYFDIIISNHVIEHVGEKEDQEIHIKEIKRCLKNNGLLYLAMPNKKSIIEPHYKVPFLSWFSIRIADKILNVIRHTKYECRPLEKKQIYEMLSRNNLHVFDVTKEAVALISKIENKKMAFIYLFLPKKIQDLILYISPNIYLVGKK